MDVTSVALWLVDTTRPEEHVMVHQLNDTPASKGSSTHNAIRSTVTIITRDN